MKKIVLFSVLTLWLVNTFFAQEVKLNAASLINNTSISGNWFLAYTYDEPENLGSFNLKRGYFTIKTKVNDIFSVRYTQDIQLDKEGADAGNVEMRLKYLYMKIKLIKIHALRNTYLEFGLIHKPWIDFEQKVNSYRVQGRMFIERFRVNNSADFGIMYAGLLGGEISENYQKTVSGKYPGQYGSFGIGIYNGPGYHAIELNNNKTLEGRLSLRPFPDFMPGLQLSYAFAFGKNNSPQGNTDFNMNLFYLSSESKFHTLGLQYYNGKGDTETRYMDQNGKAYSNNGYSAFAEIKIPETKFSVFARYDFFASDQHETIEASSRIGGLAYNFLKNKIVFDIDNHKTENEEVNIYELALEINF